MASCANNGSNSSSVEKSKERRLPLKLKPLRANGWLHAMKASSPTSVCVNNGIPSVSDSTYRAWMKRYPSALSAFDQIIMHGKGKKIALFLDYDGTLSPIVDEPDNAVMSDAMRAVVKNVASYLPTAIISGRSRDKVFEFVKLTELYYAGSHGMDIMGPIRKSESVLDHTICTNSIDKQGKEVKLLKHAGEFVPMIDEGKEVKLFQAASDFVPMIDEVFRLLVEKTKGIDGAKVENNRFCMSVHYRNVDEKDWQLVAQCADDVLKAYPRLRLTHGRKVLEVRPVIDWNKGKAMEFLLESLGLGDCDNVLPIYVGDDRTDEDAFKVLREGRRGFGILVSSIPKESDALYSLMDPSQVMEFLKALVRWKEEEASQLGRC